MEVAGGRLFGEKGSCGGVWDKKAGGKPVVIQPPQGCHEGVKW